MAIIHGVDTSKLSHAKPDLSIPIVKGRTVHIDGDFIAYMVAYDDKKGLEAIKHNTDAKIEKIRLMAGAEFIQLHLTPKESNKGHRTDQYDKTGNRVFTGLSMVKEYQAKRKTIKPKYLHLIRAYMHDKFNGIQHVDCEADDGMAIAQYEAIAAGNRNLSVIATKDKDLLMVPGLQLDWDDGGISDTSDDFGDIHIDRSKSTPKTRGRGWKMFWAQMLMGDATDNISGLPMVCDEQYLPNGKHKQCGPVLAHEILSPLKTNKEAFTVVRDLFRAYHEVKDDKGNLVHPFTNWRDGSIITPGEAFLSEARLLWMRRKKDDDDVLHWLQETCV